MNPADRESSARIEEQAAAVAFDLDGLMFNTEHLYHEVGTEILRRRGKVATKELFDAMMGRPSRISLQIMIDWHGLNDTIEQLQQETDEIFQEILPTRLAPLPGLLELLAALELRGIPKAIATSSRLAFLERVFSPFSLRSRFQFVLTSEDVRQGKPHPEIYQTAAERFGVPPGAMLVLEDSENGCKAAVSAGTIAIAVPGEHSYRHNFHGVRFVASSLADERIYQLLGGG